MFYKVLENGYAIHGGNLKWSLPKPDGNGNYTPGRWHHVKDDIVVCRNGLHLTTHPYNWYTWNCEMYAAEGKGQTDGDDNKVAFRHARLMCPVEHPQWWQDAHDFVDSLPAVKWLQPDGNPDPAWKLFTAPTWDAARHVVWDAARHAVWDAARQAVWNTARPVVWDAAHHAAWDAARHAAQDAARDAAWDAVPHVAWDAAHHAAWDAARHAVWDAVRHATQDAARDAAWDAAHHAAWDAVRHAAQDAPRHAAQDAALYTCHLVTIDLNVGKEHVGHIKACWNVWQKGYALLCDVDGVLYVYAKE